MDADDDKAYRVEAREGRFHVLDGAGRVAMVCADEASAIHYSVMLNEAYGRGYKAGYREGRQRSSKG